MRDFWNKFKSGAQAGTGFLFVLSIGAILVIALYSYCPNFHYRNAYLPKDDAKISLSLNQTKTLNQLVSKGVVISSSDLYSDIISFYSSLISWLIAILGLSGVLGYVYIQGVTKEKAEENAEQAVRNFFEKVTTHALLKTEIEKVADTDLEEINGRLTNLEEKVEFLSAGTPKDLADFDLSSIKAELASLKEQLERPLRIPPSSGEDS